MHAIASTRYLHNARVARCGADATRGSPRLPGFAARLKPAQSRMTPVAFIKDGKEAAAVVEKEKAQVDKVMSEPPAPSATTQDKVNFWEYWWPVVPVKEVDTSRPVAVDLLGLRLAVWVDNKGTWHCFQDRCPHRLAPLSEGEVQGDQLMCSYHGWKFNAGGKCTSIPQIEDPKAHTTACNSPRNCTLVYPIKVVHGLLWVFPRPGAEGAAAAAAQPLPSTAVPALLEAEADPEGSNNYQSTAWFFRDMPLRYDTLVENTIDPSHVFFAHNGAPGVKRENLVNPVMHAVDQPGGQVSAKGGFWVTREAVGTSPKSTYGLVPPNLMSYIYPYSESHFYCIPTKPGWSRIITCVVGKKDAQMPKPLRLMASLISRFPVIEHVLLRHDILDGDLYMLHAGERALLAEGNTPRAYYMPANADLSVVQWRKWLHRYAGDIPTCTPADDANMPPLMSKEQVLDRFHQHTRNCQTCKRALATLDQATLAARALALVSMVLTVAPLASNPPSLPSLLAVVVSVMSVTVAYAMQQLRQKFFYVEYVHAHRSKDANQPQH